ncbi:hypothetical protein [Amycolatopsis sp. lyj-346]|uniref:hypothetical protein n=1 Tax=Amycolatopsis sp. lyj-346 TaxID=2789289 RepID=UPI00397BACC0
MKSVVWWSVGLLFGLGLMALGLFGSGDPGSKVLCGSEEMRPGQTCDKTRYGQTSSETYEEKRQEAIDDAASFNGGGRWVTFGIGTVIAGACGWRLVVAIRRRAGRGSGPAARTVQGQQAGFAPMPGHPPQGFPQQPGFPQEQGYQQQPGFPQQQGYQQQPGFPQQQGYQQQPGFQQQGFPPPQGFQQPPPPGYGPHRQ